MRPILLKMSAFGPYAGETIIPMDELGSQGLYLITGDTGAGKTTIFDAICFALFGEASGPNRETNMFRSKYADPETATEVELTFSHNGKEYCVKRNPEYYRPAKRGEGLKKQSADAQLYLPNGQIITKVKDVTVAIEQLLGINGDQFSQISMLAQGDFLKLLLADTKTRMEIFREIFKTGYYQKLQFELEAKRKEIYGLVEDGKKSVNQYVSGIKVSEDNVLTLEVNNAKEGQMTTDDILELLGRILEQDSKDRDRFDGELSVISRELEKVNTSIGAAETLEKAKEQLASAEQTLIVVAPKEQELMEVAKQAKSELKKKETLTAQAARLNTVLPDYDKYDELKCAIEKDRNEQVQAQELLSKTTAIKEEEEKKLVTLKKEQAACEDVSVSLEKLSNEMKQVEDREKNISDLEKEYRAYNKSLAVLNEAQNNYAHLNGAFIEEQHRYEIMDQAFRDGQAGILASSLRDGDMCPVCGSTTHPCKAILLEDIPSEEELKEAKYKAEQARNEATQASSQVGNCNAVIKEKEEYLVKRGKELLDTEKICDFADIFSSIYDKFNEQKTALKAKLFEVQKKVERKKELDTIIPQLETSIKKHTDNVASYKEQVSVAKSREDSNSKQLAELTEKLEFPSKSDAIKKYNEMCDEAERLQKAYDLAENNAKKKSEEIVALKSQIDSLKKSMENAKDINLECEKEKKAKLSEEQTILINKLQSVVSRIENNEGIRNNIGKESKKIADIEKKLQWVAALADTANGKLRGKDKIMLETYIQTTYFERIIRRANLRLMTMSSGQYELKRQGEASNTRSQSGLELGVIDHYNGTERSVKTLSGGESFIASLSLALGLSDEVQSSAGGIMIDTMFVDEGFGTLDPETLDMAYSALSSLTEGNKLVGIISHVAYLKEKIDRQIIVTKEKSGGSFVRVQ